MAVSSSASLALSSSITFASPFISPSSPAADILIRARRARCCSRPSIVTRGCPGARSLPSTRRAERFATGRGAGHPRRRFSRILCNNYWFQGTAVRHHSLVITTQVVENKRIQVHTSAMRTRYSIVRMRCGSVSSHKRCLFLGERPEQSACFSWACSHRTNHKWGGDQRTFHRCCAAGPSANRRSGRADADNLFRR